MMNWFKSFFGMADRTEKAADRIAETMEGIADDLSLVRKAIRQRMGLDDDATLTILTASPANVPAIEDRTAEEGTSTHRNGRKAKAS